VQYADFAAWQRRWLDSGVLAEGLEYWGHVLRGPLQPLQLPVDRPRPERPSLRGAHLRRQLPPELAAGLRTLSWRSGVTLFTTLLAGFVALLFRRTRQDDILVGTAVEGRGRAEVEGLIGLFVNMLALRTDVSGDPSFATLLQRVREVAAGAFSHQDVPLDRLVEHLRPGRESAQSPLFQVAFGLDNVPAPPLDLPGLSASRLELRRETSRFDLTLWMVEEGEGLSALWTYSTDLFLEASIARLHEQYEALLAGALAAPEERLGDLPLAAPRREAAGEDEWGFVPGLRARRRPVALAEEAG
jgi:non-ribosomal peptide synthetase component F